MSYTILPTSQMFSSGTLHSRQSDFPKVPLLESGVLPTLSTTLCHKVRILGLLLHGLASLSSELNIL